MKGRMERPAMRLGEPWRRTAGLRIALAAVCAATLAGRGSLRAEEPDWVGPMREAHARFEGRRGTFACFGDSITVSRAFWYGLQHERRNAPPEMVEAWETVRKHMLTECWDWKGPDHGNEGQMTIRWAHENVERWLDALRPEVALILFGTNDVGALELEEYEAKTRDVVKRCLARGTVVILSTIPPKHGQAEKASAFAEAVRRIARDLDVPLTDYHAEILRRRPDDWDGALEKFRDVPGDEYQVPTLISRDGVHPSNPAAFAGDYSEEALRTNGYGLRSYLVLLKYAEVVRRLGLAASSSPSHADRPESAARSPGAAGDASGDAKPGSPPRSRLP